MVISRILGKVDKEILELTHPDDGCVYAYISYTDITSRKEVEQILQSGQYMLSLINDTLDFQTPDETENRWSLYIRIDPVRFKQIIVNLLSNSIKFTPPGGNITLRIENLEHEGNISQSVITIEEVRKHFVAGKRILLCEDHPLNAQIARRLLTAHKCQVEWAENGQIGVGMFGNGMNSVIRADGNPKFAMISTLAGAVINVILDPISFRLDKKSFALKSTLNMSKFTIEEAVRVISSYLSVQQ